MKTIQPNLITFPVFQQLDMFRNNVLITNNLIVHTKRLICPTCGSICSYNGNSNKGRHSLTNSTGTFFKKGQQKCPNCKVTIQTNSNWLNRILDDINHYIASQVLSLSTGFSEDEIVEHFHSTLNIKISKSTIHNIIKKSNDKLESLEFDYEIKDEFYGYDEQFLKIDGKRAYRIVFLDVKNNEIIYEKIHYNFSKKLLKQVLVDVFGDKTPKGFVTDMRLEYPEAFKSVFGRKIKLQFCVFHLNKLILKEYRDSLKLGKKIKWTLMHYYNMYCLFNIFYNRTFELNILRKFMKNHEEFKKNITAKKVKLLVNKYHLKLKNFEKQKEEVIDIIEKKMMKSFRKILKDKRKLRKRQGITLKVRLIESAKEKFEEIYKEKIIHPKKVIERIERIKTNFDYFIASEGEVLTNNKLEGFFGSTLKKFRKKMRKSLVSFSAVLKRKRAKQEGVCIYRKFTIFKLSKIFSTITFFS
jgi:hypothetical protein